MTTAADRILKELPEAMSSLRTFFDEWDDESMDGIASMKRTYNLLCDCENQFVITGLLPSGGDSWSDFQDWFNGVADSVEGARMAAFEHATKILTEHGFYVYLEGGENGVFAVFEEENMPRMAEAPGA